MESAHECSVRCCHEARSSVHASAAFFAARPLEPFPGRTSKRVSTIDSRRIASWPTRCGFFWRNSAPRSTHGCIHPWLRWWMSVARSRGVRQLPRIAGSRSVAGGGCASARRRSLTELASLGAGVGAAAAATAEALPNHAARAASTAAVAVLAMRVRSDMRGVVQREAKPVSSRVASASSGGSAGGVGASSVSSVARAVFQACAVASASSSSTSPRPVKRSITRR